MPLEAFTQADVYIDFPFEEAKFRWDRATRKVYRRFYGEEEVEVPSSSELFNDAIRSGEQTTREEYYRD